MVPPKQPRLSVVVPTRNRAGKIRLCVEALAIQTLASIEVLVVDDGATDDTPAVLAALATDRPGFALCVLRNERPLGANPSRNRGIREARAEFVAFLDDDCVPAPDWAAALLAGFDAPTVGAVTGLVDNAPPTNVWELVFKGTQRVHSPDGRRATRLVGCNMAARRSLLVSHHLDEDRAGVPADMTVSGRGDEEGLFVLLRRAGHEVRFVRDAQVMHDHPHTGRSLLRQAFRGGAAAARLVHKYRLPPRIDLLPFMLAFGALPLGLLDRRLLWLSAAAFAAGLTALAYNEHFRKGKTLAEVLCCFPALLLYQHVRLIGHVRQWVRLWLGMDKLDRVPRR
jgi:glycosyltransferase involved in cell wall biosynthesis